MTRALPRLIALSPGTLARPGWPAFLRRLEHALAAGLPGFLLREPRLGDGEFLEFGRHVAELRARFPDLWFALHDRPHYARALAADAVHLSFRSLHVEELRPWLGQAIALGLSTHAGDDLHGWRGADYVFHGPLRATPAKAHPREPVGLDGLERVARISACPVLALGGVAPADLCPLRERGVHGAAVLSGIFGAPDAAAATRAYLAALRGE